jgi:hypothetical protein
MNFTSAEEWIRHSQQRAEDLRQQAARDAMQPKPRWRLSRPNLVPQPVAIPCPAK